MEMMLIRMPVIMPDMRACTSACDLVIHTFFLVKKSQLLRMIEYSLRWLFLMS